MISAPRRDRAVAFLRRYTWHLALFALVAILVLYPIHWLVRGAFWTTRPGAPGDLTLDNFTTALADAETWRLFATSVGIAGAVTALALVTGIFLAWLVTRTDVPYRGVIEVLAPLPFFVPGLLLTMGWAILGNPTSGLLNVALASLSGAAKGPFNVYSAQGIIFVLALPSAAFVYLFLVGPMRNMDTGLEESARTSGAGPARAFLTVTTPLLLPAISTAGILTFIFGLESFETPAILGTPGKVFVFTNQIYQYIRWTTPPNYGPAMVLAVLLTVTMLTLVAVQWGVLGSRSFTTVTGRGYRAQPIALRGWTMPVLALFALYAGVAVVLPVGLIIATSFFSVYGFYSPETLTLQNYMKMVQDRQFLTALTNTLGLAIGGGFLTMLLGSAAAYVVVRTRFPLRRLMDWIAWLPWALPGVVLSTAMLWAYIRLPIPIYGTIWVLLLAYVTFGLPLASRTMSGVFAQVSPDLEESARVSGASWGRSFVDVLLALVRPGFVAGWFLVGFVFMRTVSVPAMLYGPGSEVLAMFSLRAWENSQGSVAAAIATLMLALMVTFIVLDQILRRLAHRRTARPTVALQAATAAAPARFPA
ncbi:MAG TPA: iron ABC transporter permease [Candidatus Limnocylindria bacterium]|nr:iron ABC transporter permease [Candidatus Limnocylindria bacterium]